METIYICTHKDFEIPDLVNGNYKIITDGVELKNGYKFPIITADNELAPLKHSYSEGFHIYDIWKKDTSSDWIGINHYRRYFQLSDDDKGINILSNPMKFNVYCQYGERHNIEDYAEILEIVNKYYPEYDTNIPDLFYPCNCCVLRRDIFDKWCSFIFGVTTIFNWRHKFYSDDDVKKFISEKKYTPHSHPDYRPELDYQSRLHSFLIERLSNLFFINYFRDKPDEKKELKLK